MNCLAIVRSLRWPLAALTATLGLTSGRAEVTFQTEVAAVISKAGCNLGTCHGNATGKGGFKLSLRGGDLDFDYAALVQDQFGRRVNGLAPDQSLLLLKATQAVAHEGADDGGLFQEGAAAEREKGIHGAAGLNIDEF